MLEVPIRDPRQRLYTLQDGRSGVHTLKTLESKPYRVIQDAATMAMYLDNRLTSTPPSFPICADGHLPIVHASLAHHLGGVG